MNTNSYELENVQRQIRHAAADLQERADKLREFVEQTKNVPVDELMDPRNAFFSNVQRAFDDASRSVRIDQARTSALASLHTAHVSTQVAR